MTAFNSPTYNIERPTGVCAFTGRPLQPGEPYVAALVEVDPDDAALAGSPAAALGMKRLDLSQEAWQAGQRPPRLFGHWRSTVPQPNQRKKLFVDDEVLLNLFRRLGDADRPDRLGFRFVLGLILMRKKKLRYDGNVQRPGPEGQEQEWWQLTPRGEQEPLELLNPQMDEERIQQVTGQLSEILEAEL